MLYSLEGEWQADIGDGRLYLMKLPGTLDENAIGCKDGNTPILTRFTRKYKYEGEVKLKKKISFDIPSGRRIFLEAERARCLRLLVDGQEIPSFRETSLSVPHVFELTNYWKGEHELTLLSDNSYLGLPYDEIVCSSAATDETQTNWNGVLGYFRLRVENPIFPESVRVYPAGNSLTVKVEIDSDRTWKGRISVGCEALKREVFKDITIREGMTEIILSDILLAESAVRWDEYEGKLYELTVSLYENEEKVCEKNVTFGIRDFGVNKDGQLTINGRGIFLRGETNCAVFPETGYCPMAMGDWMDILRTYQSYGVNCVRFHSHCPPEAAFCAADRLGLMMQPELSHWNPKDAFISEDSLRYYETELRTIIRMLANHPSFVMLTFGNELCTSEKGHEHMKKLIKMAHKLDDTRLYANGSNVHYGEKGCDAESDFYTSFGYYEHELRGTFAGMKGYINHSYPNTMTDYNESMKALRKAYIGPVFSFEAGQFEILPDFDELDDFQGITIPENLYSIKRRVEEKGLLPVWRKYVEASGKLSKISYKEEIEAAMRTEGLAGISLLGLQDFPGQGTALVGMLNSHLSPKPYDFSMAESFRSFFAAQLPLVLLPKYTYESTESLEARIKIANFGKERVRGELSYKLCGENFFIEGKLTKINCQISALTDCGIICIPLGMVQKPVQLKLTVSIGEMKNSYPIWVYPPASPARPDKVYETPYLDERAKEILTAGGIVYLSPASTQEAIPSSVQAQFTTDFWSVGTFPSQEGTMGQLIQAEHPVFKNFPTEFHTNWQWWAMASRRAVIMPEQYDAIITEMDSCTSLRPMAQLLECRCLNGKLLFSTMGLQDLQAYPEARALLKSIYQYLDSEEFLPEQEISWESMKTMVK